MGPAAHTAIGIAGGSATWALTGSFRLALLFLAVQVLLDLDMLLDFLRYDSQPLSVSRFLDESAPDPWPGYMRLLHGHDLALLLAAANLWLGSSALWVIVASIEAHLLADDVGNRLRLPTRMHPLFYLLAFRALHGFRKERTGPWRR